MKLSLKCFSFFLVLSFLFSCNGEGFQLDCNSNNSAFREAALDGDIKEMKRLVGTGRVDINAHCGEHDTALMEILKDRYSQAAAKYLIEDAGVDITIPDRYGNTLLHMAANGGYSDIIRLLLRKGVEVDSKNSSGETPLMCTFNGETAELLIKNGADVNHENDESVTSLHKAAKYNSWGGLTSILIRSGADVNHEDNEGKTPLHWAACPSSGNNDPSDKIVCLLENYAAINSQDNDGDTPLHRAAYWGSKKAAATLLAWGADINIRNNKGHKPLDPAHSTLSPEETFLVVAGARCAALAEDILDNNRSVDINTKDENGDTALIGAARYGRITLVERLIARGANLNLKNNEGQTALMVAIEAGHEAVALALIPEKKKDRINLDLKDNRGWSALKYARKGKHKAIAEALLDNGAKEYLIRNHVKNGLKRVLPGAAKAGATAALAL